MEIGVSKGLKNIGEKYLAWVQKGIKKEESRMAVARDRVEKLPDNLKEMRKELIRRIQLLDKGAARLVILGFVVFFVAIVIGSYLPGLIGNIVTGIGVAGLAGAALCGVFLGSLSNRLIRKWKRILKEAGLEYVSLTRVVEEEIR